jgi:hypothetical protein
VSPFSRTKNLGAGNLIGSKDHPCTNMSKEWTTDVFPDDLLVAVFEHVGELSGDSEKATSALLALLTVCKSWKVSAVRDSVHFL